MASFEDYDEFGNYIGADLESDEEEDISQAQFAPQPHVAPLEGYEDEQMQDVDDTALMEIDGARQVYYPRLPSLIMRSGQSRSTMLWYFTKTSNTTHRLRMSTALMSKRWCRKRMLNLSRSP